MSKVSLLQLMLFDFKLYIYSYLNAIRLFFLQFFFHQKGLQFEKLVDLIKHFHLKCKHNYFIYMPVFEQYIVFDIVQFYVWICVFHCSQKEARILDFFKEFCWYFCLRISVISFVLLNCLRLFFLYRMKLLQVFFFFRNLFYAE